MKARTNLVITMLMVAGCCVSSSLFCADSAPKALNCKTRNTFEREYAGLEKKKTKTMEELEKQVSIATQLREAHEQLQKQSHDNHPQHRQEQIEIWSAKEKKSRNALYECQTTPLIKENKNITELLKNKDLSIEAKKQLIARQHEITHTGKELSEQEAAVNPENENATIFRDQFLLQSAILGHCESLLQQQELHFAMQTKSIPVTPQNTSVVDQATPEAAAPQSTTAVIVSIAVEPKADVKKTNDAAQPASQKKDENCTIL